MCSRDTDYYYLFDELLRVYMCCMRSFTISHRHHGNACADDFRLSVLYKYLIQTKTVYQTYKWREFCVKYIKWLIQITWWMARKSNQKGLFHSDLHFRQIKMLSVVSSKPYQIINKLNFVQTFSTYINF